MDIRNIENIYTCAPIQEGMLFHTIHQPNSGLYIEQVSFQIIGELDHAMFEKAWQESVQMHSALRTTFHWKESEQMLQVVHKRMDIRVEDIDLYRKTVDKEDLESKIESIAENLKKKGFDLSKGR